MSYTVLARRYRSASFDQVIGQEPVANTLKNAIRSNRVAHAYLFTGTRGVGKTSMARIFARALNAPATVPDCPPPSDPTRYPDPDVQQRMADAIMRGDDLNVIEIDGASNNSVDAARDLIANAGLAPSSQAPFKIYIIDEVHMLTTQAFNALLKTMEEPPSHVKFILCTTEAHKVPPTIQSRCQRFDFRDIPTARIADHLRDVLAREGLEAQEEVVWQVAQLGSGSMRDALSLMDRLTAAGENPLTADLLTRMLGLPPQQLIIDLIDAIAEHRVGDALIAIDQMLRRGISQDQVAQTLLDRFHQLLRVTACGVDSEVIELSQDLRETAARQAGGFGPASLVYMIAVMENISRSARSSANPRALLDASIARLALAEQMVDAGAGAVKKN